MASQISQIKVIHIDDEENLIKIMKLTVEAIDPQIEVNGFTDPNNALKQIDESVDCIITDYKMPKINGLDVTRKIREKWDIPIIIFTGQGSEEVASRAFSIGVNSYLQKSIEPSIFEVLVQEIRNHHERYTYASRLAESELRYRTFLENSLDAVSFNVGTEIRYCNQAASELLGYSREELCGMSVLNITHPDFIQLVNERTILRQKGECVPKQYEVKLVRKDGSFVWVEFKVGRIELEGEFGSLSVIRDISEHKNYEYRLEQLLLFTRSLNKVNSLNELYQVTYEILDTALGYEVFDIIQVIDDYIIDVKRPGSYKRIFKAPLDGSGVTVRTAVTGETQLVNDVRLDPDYVPGTRKENMLSELAVPVFLGYEVFLILNVESRKVNAFTDDDKRLLEIFSSVITPVLEQLHIYNNKLESPALNRTRTETL